MKLSFSLLTYLVRLHLMFILLLNSGLSVIASSVVNSPDVKDGLSVKISGPTSFCLNSSNAAITFEGSGGTAPYTFTFEIDGTQSVTTTGSNGKAQVSVNTSTAKSIVYKITKIADSTNTPTNITDVNTTVIINPLPTVNFSFTNDNSCSGTLIQFTSYITDKEPFTYTWNFGDNITSTLQNPTHEFNSVGCGLGTFNVTLTITDKNGCPSSCTKVVTVKQKPNIDFGDTKNPFSEFSNCGKASIANPNFEIVVENKSESASCISSYSVDWGDGSTKESNISFPLSHTYSKLGAFNLIITAIGKNLCTNSKTYIVKNVTNPSVGVTSPGTTTNLCAPTGLLNFAIAGWGLNSPGTTYEVDYGDNLIILTYTQEELITSQFYNKSDPSKSDNFPIPYSYTKSNCPKKEYVVTVTASNVCSSTAGTVNNITVLSKAVPDFSVNQACLNSSITFKNLTQSGYNTDCSQTANYTWNFGDGSSPVEVKNSLPKDVTHTFALSGTYSTTLTVENYCGKSSITHPVTINPLPTATISGSLEGGASTTGTITVCQNTGSPTVTFIGTNGTAPYTFTYKINNGSSKTIQSNSGNSTASLAVPTGTSGTFVYTLLSVQEGGSGCSQPQTGSVTITVNPAPKATISGTKNVCLNDTPPDVVFTGSNGTSPYTFVYNINGGSNQNVTTTAGNSISIKANTNVAGIYKYNLINVTDASANSCTQPQSGTATITVNQLPSITTTLTNKEFCNGDVSSPIVFDSTIPSSSYNWTNSNTAIGLKASGTGNIPQFTAKNTTTTPIISTITVTPIANGCSGANQSFTITVNPSASVVFSQNNQSICSGETTSEVTLSSTTPNVTSWTSVQPVGISGVIASGTDKIPAQTLINSTNTAITIQYKAKATSLGGTSCSGIESIYSTIVNPKPVIGEIYNEKICSNSLYRLSPANGGSNNIPAGTKYIWGSPNITPLGAITGAKDQKNPQVEFSQTLENLTSSIATVTYSVIPVTSNCTGAPFNVILTVVPKSTINPIANLTLCDNELINDVVFGATVSGTVFNWTTNNTSIGIQASGTDKIQSFNARNNGTSPNTATITATSDYDYNGFKCSSDPVKFAITVNPSAQVDNPGNIFLCSGKAATIKFTTKNSGGTTSYTWSNSNFDIGLGSSGTGNITFTPNNTGTTTITVTPSYTNNGENCSGQPEQFIVTIIPSATVDQPSEQVLCNGKYTDEIIFTGNVTNATYNWTVEKGTIGLPLSGTGNIASIKAINNGSVPIVETVTVTPSVNGCEGTAKKFTITVNPSPYLTSQPQSETICLGENLKQLSVSYINGLGVPTYQWYSNTTNSTTGSIPIANADKPTFAPPGNEANTMYYYCIITFQSSGCNILISDIAKIGINPVPVVSTIYKTVGSGESFIIIPASSEGNKIPLGTTYTWLTPVVEPSGAITGTTAQQNPQSSITQTLINSTNGTATVTYVVTPTVGNCVGLIFKVIVMVNPSLSPNVKVTPATCNGSGNGSITTNIKGGTPFSTGEPYKIEWTGPNGFTSSLANLSNLVAGKYNLSITDAIGIKYSFNYTIDEPDKITLKPDYKKNISCKGKADGEIGVTASGGTLPYKYIWTKDGVYFSDNEDIRNIRPGKYEVILTDVSDCSPQKLSFEITEPEGLAIKLTNQTNVKCRGESTGSISVEIQGGTKVEISPGIFDYSYSWLGPNEFSDHNKDLNNIAAGLYSLTVTDASGCDQELSIQITEPEEIKIKAETTTITCYGNNNASIKLTISGGVPPYDALWDNLSKGTFQDNLSAGYYGIKITDTNNCTTGITVNIPEPPLFKISPVIKHVSCYGASDGSVSLNYEGGTAPIAFAWNDNPTAGTTRNNLTSGQYSVNIKDGSGCTISRTFQIIEPDPLFITASVTDDFDCDTSNGGSIDLSVSGGTSPYQYIWSNGSTNEDLAHVPAGNYLINVTDASGCSNSAQYSIKKPTVIDINVSTKIKFDCENKKIKEICTAKVNGGLPPYTLNWSLGSISGISSDVIETDQSGTVVLNVKDSRGCPSTYSFNTDVPVLGINYKLIDCNLRSYQFNAFAKDDSESFTFKWDFGDGYFSEYKNPKHVFQNAGLYNVKLRVTDKESLCTSDLNEFVNVEAPLEITIDKEPKFCQGESVLIYGLGANRYKWSNGTQGDSILIKAIGNYSVTGFSKAGCYNTFDFVASQYDMNYSIKSDKKVVSKAQNAVHFWCENVPFTNYFWEFGDGNVGQGSDLWHNFDIVQDEHFNVKLSVSIPAGCVRQDSINIWIEPYVPNTFTPNNDGFNDVYMKGWKIEIYNRNGVLLYNGIEGWNGMYNGNPVSEDTYFVIVFYSSEYETKKKTSFVTVIR